ncbi:UNVERIFIED_CONTAM: hypothetical protein GTU68_053179 [Idotea baltica]|nr:hypothetical protein [Idotea baltica]
MNGVIGMTELLLDTQLTTTQTDYLNVVQTSGETLLELINDILDFSKIEAGKMELERVSFCLQDLLGDTLKLLGTRAHDKGLELAFSIEPKVPDFLMGDPSRLRQIIVNLVGNAIKFTQQGEVLLNVGLVWRNDHSIRLKFDVSDTGIGIPENKLDDIFEAFQQADTSTTRSFGGTGLGLSISSRLVSLMGGELSCESKVGQGSTFRFQASFSPSEVAVQQKIPTADFAGVIGLNILLAEDNLVNQKLAVGILNKLEHSVTVAEDGLLAISKFQEQNQNFDVILMDVQMPNCDGLEATRRIREIEQSTGQRIPIIAMTAHAMPGDRQKCLDAGMDDYLTKPIRSQKLKERLNSIPPSAKPSSTSPDGAAITAGSNAPAATAPLRIAKEDESLFDFDLQIDWAEALRGVDGDRDLYGLVAEAFVAEVPKYLEQAAEGFNDSNATQLHRCGHTLKGMMLSVGATKASEWGRTLESWDLARPTEQSDDIQAQLKFVLDDVVRQLAQFKT